MNIDFYMVAAIMGGGGMICKAFYMIPDGGDRWSLNLNFLKLEISSMLVFTWEISE